MARQPSWQTRDGNASPLPSQRAKEQTREEGPESHYFPQGHTAVTWGPSPACTWFHCLPAVLQSRPSLYHTDRSLGDTSGPEHIYLFFMVCVCMDVWLYSSIQVTSDFRTEENITMCLMLKGKWVTKKLAGEGHTSQNWSLFSLNHFTFVAQCFLQQRTSTWRRVKVTPNLQTVRVLRY